MKKTIATLLAGMLTVSCGVGVVSAEETVFDNHSNENFSLVSWADTYNSV